LRVSSGRLAASYQFGILAVQSRLGTGNFRNATKLSP
jgi:hypothetical protein